MSKKTPPFKEYPEWTEARFWSFIRSALRQAWQRWPPKYRVKDKASRPYKGKDKRRKKEFQCSDCKGWFKSSEVEVDHITPCGSLRSYEDLPRFVKNMFVGEDKLRLLCKSCHREVTNEH